MKSWSGKRYHTLNHYLRNRFGEKVFKVSLDAGFTCPHRSPEGTGGCIYCSPRGSGDCAGDSLLPVTEQFQQVRKQMQQKWPGVKKYIAYFQAYTATLAPAEDLEKLYRTALAQPGVVGLSLATRPDCLPAQVVDLLKQLNRETMLWVELGLQSAHDSTLQKINRGHDYQCFVQVVKKLHRAGINVCCHIILGLPGEDREMMLATGRAVAALGIEGIKIHALHVLRDTRLANMWQQGETELLTREQYAELTVDVLEVMPPDVVIHRVTGDAPRDILLAPDWIKNKWQVLQAIDKMLEARNSWQGRCSIP